MAKERKVEYELSLKDEATKVHKQFADAVNRDAISISNAAKGAGAALGTMFSIGAASQFISKFADAETQSAKLTQALSNVGAGSADVRKALDEQAEALSKKTAVDGDEITALQAMIVGMTGNVDAAQSLTPAVLDLARGLNISTEAAARMFSKTNEGAEGLKRAGITIGETNNEAERTARIAEEVRKKWGGMAEAFGATSAGQMQGIANSLEDVQETLGEILFNIIKPMLPAITMISDVLQFVMPKAVLSLQIMFAKMFQGIVSPLAAVEDGLNRLGVTQSNVFQRAFDNSKNMIKSYQDQLYGVDAVNEALKKNQIVTEKQGTATVLMKDSIKKLKDELDQLNPGTKEYTDVLMRLVPLQWDYQAAVDASASAVREKLQPGVKGLSTDFRTLSTPLKTATVQLENVTVGAFDSIQALRDELAALKTQILTDAADAAFGFESIWSAVSGSIRTGMEAAFSGSEGAGKSAMKSLANAAISMGELYLSVALAQAYAKGVPTFGASLPADFALVAAGTVALEAARAAINTFHEGGTMGYGGERIPLKSDERRAVLRVGETVIPTKPGESYGSGTVLNATININAPGTPVQLVMSALKDVARQIGANTLSDITVNQRNQIAFS